MMDFFTDLHPFEALGNTFGLPRVNNFFFGSTERINVFTTGPNFTAESLIEFYKPNGLNDLLNNEEKTLIEGHEYFLEVSKKTENEVEKVEFSVEKKEDATRIVLPEKLKIINENIKNIESNINKSEGMITDLQSKALSIKKTKEVLFNLNVNNQGFRSKTDLVFDDIKNNFQTEYQVFLDKYKCTASETQGMVQVVQELELYIDNVKDLIYTSTNFQDAGNVLMTVRPLYTQKVLEHIYLNPSEDLKRLCKCARELNPLLYFNILTTENIQDILEQQAVLNKSEISRSTHIIAHFMKGCSAEEKTTLENLIEGVKNKNECISDTISVISNVYLKSFHTGLLNDHILTMDKFYNGVEIMIKSHNEINTENKITVKDVLVDDNYENLNTSLDEALATYEEQELTEKLELSTQQKNLIKENEKMIKEVFKSSEDNIKDSKISLKLDENKKNDGFFISLFGKLSIFKFW